MARRAGKKASDIIVWILLGLLILGLAGFGIGSFGGGATQVASVGSSSISAQDYGRALQSELRAQQAEGGLATLSEMRALGLDRAVLDNLIARAALAHEADQIGLSVGDAEVARQIRLSPAFTGPGGEFDRATYDLSLSQAGFTVAEFEDTVRRDTARSILQAAIVGGVAMPEGFTDTLLAYQSETRNFTLARVTEADLTAGLAAPTDEELQAYYDENAATFERPEQRQITYVWITPDMLLDSVEVDEAALAALYQERIDEFVQPERRLLERLVFPTLAEAEAAMAALEAGETDYDTLVTDRGLTLEDVDLGDVRADELSDAAATVIFADTESEILGPLESRFGPALFRINAVLAPVETTLEEAREDLSNELSQDAARRAIDGMIEDLDDLLASGATLEELAAETEMQLGSIDWSDAMDEGISGYEAFRAAAAQVSENDFPELLALSDGGQFALRLDGVIAPATPPLAEITEEVTAAWRAANLRARLEERAEAIVANLAVTGSLEESGLTLAQETDTRRQDFIPDAPPTLVAQVFQLAQPGDVVVIPGARAAVIARLDAVNAGYREAADVVALRALFQAQAGNALAADIFEAYGRALEAEVGISLDANVINAVHAQFP